MNNKLFVMIVMGVSSAISAGLIYEIGKNDGVKAVVNLFK